ncbi:MAG: SUMF1/EgtB/PvdO family nonheme iron enzyme [Saprospiraceae bacterium]
MSELNALLPLHRLFVQLQNDRFYIGPAERLRVQQLLASSQNEWLTAEGREGLKYQIAPLICRHPVEQDRFYKIYDDFLKDLVQPLPDPPEEEMPGTGLTSGLLKWLPWILGGLLLVTGLWWWINRDTGKPKIQDHPITEINNRTEIKPGETTVFQTIDSSADIAQMHLAWKVLNVKNELEHVDSNQEFRHTISDPGKNPDNFYKTIVLESYHRDTKDTLGFSRSPVSLKIICPDGPKPKDSIRTEGTKQIGQTIRFFPPRDLQKHWMIRWDFDDGEYSSLTNPEHSFKTKRTFNVKLSVTDTTQSGYCTKDIFYPIDINEEMPQLAEERLFPDVPKPTWDYTLFAWLLAFVLLGIAAFFFWKWWNRPYIKEPVRELIVSDKLRNALKPNDHAPYAVPYRSNNSKVQFSEQVELATAFRRRQAGQVAQLNIYKSISATIEKAGFVDLRFALNTRPTQYIFLIDLQNEASHQAQLFRYLTQMLEGQEVLAEIFYYKNDFDRFWNRTHPEGLSLDLLAMYYGDRRMVVFGDGYRMLAPNNEQGDKLKTYLADNFRRWELRMLVTPTPVASWSFKEARLYRLFAVFHADLEGLQQAAEYAEKGMDEEILPPTFAEWEKQCNAKQLDVDTDRLWQTPRDHLDYLKEAGKTEIYPWLRALVVYPELNWNMTIAIGRKLGIDVQYEHLLLLARIPWMQEGMMKSALWKVWWQGQDPIPEAEEKLVREAIREELTAIEENSAPGFANQKVQTRLAVQDFGLTPGKPSTQDAIRYILDNTTPSPQFKEELDLIPIRHLGFVRKPGPPGNTITAYLEQQNDIIQTEQRYIDRTIVEYSSPKPTETRPFYTLNFWLGTCFGLASLACFWCLLLINAASLYAAFPPGRGWFVVQKMMQTDEAARLNNQAVNVWNAPDSSKDPKNKGNVPFEAVDTETRSKSAIRLLVSALEIRPDYSLAATNKARVYYNDGRQFLESNEYERAIYNFNLSLPNDSLRRLTAEALAIAYFKSNKIDSACYWIKQTISLNRASGRGYFNWLAAKGLCGPDTFKLRILVLDEATGQPIGNAALSAQQIPSIRSDRNNGQINYAFPLGKVPQNVFVRIQKTGYVEGVGTFIPNNDGQLDTLRLIGDRDGDGVPDKSDRCPDQAGQIGASGCPDRDGDGVVDNEDKCPDEPGSEKDGCGPPPDRDGDGVPDGKDNCPDKPGKIELDGCPADRDGDGVPDAEDACPDEPGSVENAGCENAAANDAIEKLRTSPPTEELIREAMQGFQYDAYPQVSEEEGRRILEWLGVSGVQRSQATAGEPYYFGQFRSGYFMTIWIGTYEKTDRYGIRYGQQYPDYHPSNETYFEIERPAARPRKSGLEMVYVQGGIFTMGSPESEEGRDKHECQHQDTVGNFSIGKYEVTVADWREVMGQNPPELFEYSKGCEDCPINQISWEDVQEFLKILNAKYPGKNYRLPTEAEWEYAARGGNVSRNYVYAGSNDLTAVAWYLQSNPRPVGTKQPNELGLFDMSGNVLEWCQDLYKSYPNCGFNEKSIETHIYRGGSYLHQKDRCRVACRVSQESSWNSDFLGFRLTLN